MKVTTLDEWIEDCKDDPAFRAAWVRLQKQKRAFGERLHKLVFYVSDITAKQLSKKTRIPLEAIQAFIRGQMKPQPESLERLSKYFGIETELLWPEE